MKNQSLSVRLYGEPVGILEKNFNGKMAFYYHESASQAISLSMPLCLQPYSEMHCEAFFGGLLPESDTARKLIGKHYGISANNTFALLKAIGHDCAGAISFHEINDSTGIQQSFPLSGRKMKEEELYRHIRDLPKMPLFLGIDDLRLSLAGVHNKAAICLIDHQIAIPANNCPTTHILKTAIPELEGVIENEYFCLRVASQVGLPAPSADIWQIKDLSFLLIERYDRHIQDQQVTRIHQEDFCQALGILSTRKYQAEGGANLKACFDLLQNSARSIIDRNTFASGVVFNFLMGNMDAHAKNFSLLHENKSSFTLAPFYDIVCTRIYPDLTKKMAMKIGSQYQADRVLARHWEKLCHEVNYSYPALKQIMAKQANLILKAMKIERDYLVERKRKTQVIDRVIHWVEKHITRTLQWFEING